MKTEINTRDYKRFIVTGYYYNSTRRFRKSYESTLMGAMAAFNINLWRGNVWGVRVDTGKREKIKTVFN